MYNKVKWSEREFDLKHYIIWL